MIMNNNPRIEGGVKGLGWMAAAITGLCLALAPSVWAGPVNLGSAADYAVVAVGGTVSLDSDFKLYQSSTVIDGNVAEGPHTILGHEIDATVNGRWDYDLTDANPLVAQPKSNTPLGGFHQLDLSGVIVDARAASLAASLFVPTQTFASLSEGQNIVGGAGLNVIRITGDSTIKTFLTLSGAPTSQFVFQFTSSTGAGSDVLSFSGMNLNLVGGINPLNIVWNLNGLGGDLNINAMADNQLLSGIFLAPDRNATIDHGNIFGEVLAGGSGTLLNIHSTSHIMIPEMPTSSALLLGFGLLSGASYLRRRRIT
jgi:hypothetical protein